MEQLESKVNERGVAKSFTVGEGVKVPLLESVHHLENDGPRPRAHLDDLLDSLLFLLKKVLINFITLPMKLLQEVIEISFKPHRGVIGGLSRDVEPRLGLHVEVLLFGAHVDVQLVQLVALNDTNSKPCFFSDGVRNLGQLLKLVKNFDHRVNWVVVLRGVAQLRLVACDLPDCNNNHSDETQDAKTFGDDAHEVENLGDGDNRSIKRIEEVSQVHSIARESFQDDLDGEYGEEHRVDFGHYILVDVEGVGEGQVKQDEECVRTNNHH